MDNNDNITMSRIAFERMQAEEARKKVSSFFDFAIYKNLIIAYNKSIKQGGTRQ